MNEELKPCPLCGAQVQIRERRSLKDFGIGVHERTCPIYYHDYRPNSQREQIIAAWNTRTTDARITSLEEVLEQAATWFEEYAAEHYRKAKNAPDGREQHGREVNGKLNKERAAILRAALSLRGEG